MKNEPRGKKQADIRHTAVVLDVGRKGKHKRQESRGVKEYQGARERRSHFWGPKRSATKKRRLMITPAGRQNRTPLSE